MHVLVVGTMDCAHELDQWVDEHARVDHVATFQTAIDAMRSEPYDIIISSAAEFIPFREFHFTEQASAILDKAPSSREASLLQHPEAVSHCPVTGAAGAHAWVCSGLEPW